MPQVRRCGGLFVIGLPPPPPPAIIQKSKEMQHISVIMEEKETFAQQARGGEGRRRAHPHLNCVCVCLSPQSRALQELLRQNAEELEKYKKIVATTATDSSTPAESAPECA